MLLGRVTRYRLIQVRKAAYQVAREKFHSSFPHISLHKQIAILRLLRQGEKFIHKLKGDFSLAATTKVTRKTHQHTATLCYVIDFSAERASALVGVRYLFCGLAFD